MHKATRIFFFTALGYGVALPASIAQQQTGTHLDSRISHPTVVHFNAPTRIDEILQLIEAGRNEDAVAVAYEHVENLQSVRLLAETSVPDTLYYALNALCIALMTTGQIEEALDTCSHAIREVPQQWAAWNSRGTTYFATASFEEALGDFLRALALAPNDENIVDTLQWNIRLTNERLAGN